MKFLNLNSEKLLSDYNYFSIDPKDSYITSYPVFIQYFKNLKSIERDNLIISSHFTYGWMPRVIQLNLNIEIEVLNLLNGVKDGQVLSDEDIKVLKQCVNNSLVGLSKLLHFINPEYYAIWDSRVHRYIS